VTPYTAFSNALQKTASTAFDEMTEEELMAIYMGTEKKASAPVLVKKASKEKLASPEMLQLADSWGRELAKIASREGKPEESSALTLQEMKIEAEKIALDLSGLGKMIGNAGKAVGTAAKNVGAKAMPAAKNMASKAIPQMQKAVGAGQKALGGMSGNQMMGRGAMVGAGLGAAKGLVAPGTDPSTGQKKSRLGSMVGGAAKGAVGGAVVGAAAPNLMSGAQSGLAAAGKRLKMP
jgi:hypothetical protein